MSIKSNNHSESGRSLLEAIGTLVVMGLISAGGIIGYSAAMRKHDANELANRLMGRAMDASTQAMTGRTPDLSNWDPNDGKYAIPANGLTSTPTTFTLTALNVPKGVCEQIHTLQWPFASISPEMSSCTETADMTFTFNKDLRSRKAGDPAGGSGTEGGEEGGEEGTTCPGFIADACTTACTLVDGEPVYTYANGTSCGDGKVCSNGDCVCTEGYGEVGNKCVENAKRYCVQTDGNGECTQWAECNTTYNTGNSIVGVPYGTGACASADNRIYCALTIDSPSKCQEWQVCNTPYHTGDRIVGKSFYGGEGACAPANNRILCSYTSDDGECVKWEVCETIEHTGEWILNIPNAGGSCITDTVNENLFCYGTNDNAECESWSSCPADGYYTVHSPISANSHSVTLDTPNAQGTCGAAPLYCKATNASGQCTEWGSCDMQKAKNIQGTANATATCCWDNEPTCFRTNADGACTEWGCCAHGTSNLIVGTANATGTCAQHIVYCNETNTQGQCTDWRATDYTNMCTKEWVVEVYATPGAYVDWSCSYYTGGARKCQQRNSQGKCTLWVG